jgi:hypothetical protein
MTAIAPDCKCSYGSAADEMGLQIRTWEKRHGRIEALFVGCCVGGMLGGVGQR